MLFFRTICTADGATGVTVSATKLGGVIAIKITIGAVALGAGAREFIARDGGV